MHSNVVRIGLLLGRLFIVVFLVVAGAPSAWSDVLLQDDFDGDTLDPAWEITLVDATGWTYEVADGNLTVTDVAFESFHGEWSFAILGQEFDWTGNFEVSCSFGWDSESSNRAMQTFSVALIDTGETRVAAASYHDPWDQSRGHITAVAGGESYYPQPNMLEHSGQGSFTLRRTNGVVTVLWNDQEVVAGIATKPVYRLELNFMSGAWENAIFGYFSVDQIMCSGDAWTTADTDQTWGAVKALYR